MNKKEVIEELRCLPRLSVQTQNPEFQVWRDQALVLLNKVEGIAK